MNLLRYLLWGGFPAEREAVAPREWVGRAALAGNLGVYSGLRRYQGEVVAAQEDESGWDLCGEPSGHPFRVALSGTRLHFWAGKENKISDRAPPAVPACRLLARDSLAGCEQGVRTSSVPAPLPPAQPSPLRPHLSNGTMPVLILPTCPGCWED